MVRGTARTPFRRPARGRRPDGVRGRAKSPRWSRCTSSIRRGPARPPPHPAAGAQLSTTASPPSTARRQGLPPRTSRRHGRSMDGTTDGSAGGGRRRPADGGRAGSTAGARRRARAGGRDAVRGRPPRRGPGPRTAPPDATRVGRPRRAARGAARYSLAAARRCRRSWSAVPRADAPLRPGPPRGGSGRGAGRRRARRRRGHRRVRRACWPAAAWCRCSTPDGLRTTYEPVAAGRRAPGRRSRAGAVLGTVAAGHRAAGRPACTGGCAASGAPTSTRSCCSCRRTSGCCRCPSRGPGPLSAGRAPGEPGAQPGATSRPCSWLTRDSVTPSIRPISARVRSSR